jgi:hypothetical protein
MRNRIYEDVFNVIIDPICILDDQYELIIAG